MNNLPAVANLPSHLAVLQQNAALQSINQDAVKGISGGAWPRISLKGGYFRLQDPQGQEIVVPERHLDVVIVAVNPHGLSKIFYSGAYDPSSDGTAPDCYSDNGVAPSARAAKPQCATCEACPHNVWGSKITPSGAQVKACADTKKVAVLLANNTAGAVFELRIPAASLSNWGAYVRGLDAAGIPAASIITRLSFDTAADYPKLLFGTPVLQAGESPYITPDMLADVMDLINTGQNEIAQCTGAGDKPRNSNTPVQTMVAAAQSTTVAAAPNFGYGPPRAPMAPALPPRPPHVSAPPLPGGITGATPPPNPAFPHITQPGQEAAPAKRTRTRKAAPAPEAAPPSGVPSIPPFLRNAPPSTVAPVTVPQTDARMDDMLSQAMRT